MSGERFKAGLRILGTGVLILALAGCAPEQTTPPNPNDENGDGGNNLSLPGTDVPQSPLADPESIETPSLAPQEKTPTATVEPTQPAVIPIADGNPTEVWDGNEWVAVENEWQAAMDVDLSSGSPRALELDGIGLSSDYTLGGKDVEYPSLKEAGFTTLGLSGVAGDCAEVQVDVPGFRGSSLVLFADILSSQGYLRIPVNIASLRKGDNSVGAPIIISDLYKELFPDLREATLGGMREYCERLVDESAKVNFFVPLFPLQADSVDPTLYATTTISSVRTIDGGIYTRDQLGDSGLGKRFDFVKTVCGDPDACYFRCITMDPPGYVKDLNALQELLVKSGLGVFPTTFSDRYGQ